jgi:drug/metabolite transporter (DMT)-like permease
VASGRHALRSNRSRGRAACYTGFMRGTTKADDAEIRAGSGSPSARSSYLAIGALALMAVFWGYNWVVMKVALRYADPAIFVALRVSLGAAFLFLLLVILRRRLRPTSLRLTLCVGLFQTSGSTGLTMWALASGAAGNTAVLVFTMPLWLLLLSWVVLGERLRGVQWFSVALALAGLCFVLAPWRIQGTPLSNVLAVVSGISWAAGTVAAKILSRRHKVDILSLNAWQMLIGSIPLVIVALLFSRSSPVWSGTFIAALLFNIVLVTGLGLLLWFYALRILRAGTTGLASLATPVLGVASAWIQLGERPGVYEAVGMVLIVSSLGVLALQQIMAGPRGKRVKKFHPTESDHSPRN